MPEQDEARSSACALAAHRAAQLIALNHDVEYDFDDFPLIRKELLLSFAKQN
jgi:hypothetical protein